MFKNCVAHNIYFFSLHVVLVSTLLYKNHPFSKSYQPIKLTIHSTEE
ncbi:MAG: hypothetical protein ACQERC_01325 [Bacteroidota bacterium]